AMTDRNLEVKAVAATFMSVAAVTVILRCYVRLRIVKAFGWDDGAMVIAMVFYALFSGSMIGGSLYGTGRHFSELTAQQRVTAMEYWWFCEIAYCFASVGCKVSVCIFLLRITVKREQIYILYCVMGLTAICGLAFMLIMLLQCKPLQYFWTRSALDPSIPGSCMNVQIVIAMTYVYSAFAAICDFTVGILPIFLVRNLSMRRQTKMAVVGILGMACIASSAVIIRIPWVYTFEEVNDFLYATVEIAVWSNIETGLGISAGSLATLRPLLRLLFPRSSQDGGSYTPSPGSRRLPLGSLDSGAPHRFRPDKLAVTVTTVKSQHPGEELDDWERTSQEQLTERPPLPGIAEESGLGMGIHRTIEVNRTVEVTQGEYV
ncbi:putative integral membrane protein, partial [Aspergillus ruber CBS 135680]